ncbi:MAG: glycosyltransferase family A protein [Candidatus Methanomethylicaceae archaeon]
MILRDSINTLPYSLQGINNLEYDKSKVKMVFVDGGSTDGSLEFLEKFKYQNTGVYRDIIIISGNYDVTEGRNECIRNADGEFILFVDSDVVVPRDLLLELVKIFSNDPKVAFVNVPCIVERNVEGWVDKVYRSMREPQGMSCAAIRLSAINDVGPYFVGFSRGENPNELIFRLRRKGYRYVVIDNEALHIKQKRRGFKDYLKTSLTASVIHHYQEIEAGRKYLILKYIYYTTLLVSLLLIPFFPRIFTFIFGLLFILLVVRYMVKSHGNIYSLLIIIVGILMPLGMLILLLRKLKDKIAGK